MRKSMSGDEIDPSAPPPLSPSGDTSFMDGVPQRPPPYGFPRSGGGWGPVRESRWLAAVSLVLAIIAAALDLWTQMTLVSTATGVIALFLSIITIARHQHVSILSLAALLAAVTAVVLALL
jgi:hypothetical protein